ncbi:MAG TPA: CbtA family protein [Acidimicrobiales bacterium]
MTIEALRRFDPTRLGPLALTAAAVGLLAGIVAALFATVAGEPAIEDAIAIEEAQAEAEGAAPDDAAEEAEVSRSDQRGVGLFAAYALTGAAFGGLLALTAHGLRRGRPDVWKRVVMGGAILAGAVTVAPWLKYPPNPPAVGDPDTLAERQSWYVTTILVAALVGLGATILARRLRDAGWPDHRRLAAVAAAVVAPMLVVFAAFPPGPDEVPVPAQLVWRFRVASLGANLTLWGVLTLAVAWLAAEAQAHLPGADDDRRPAPVSGRR